MKKEVYAVHQCLCMIHDRSTMSHNNMTTAQQFDSTRLCEHILNSSCMPQPARRAGVRGGESRAAAVAQLLLQRRRWGRGRRRERSTQRGDLAVGDLEVDVVNVGRDPTGGETMEERICSCATGPCICVAPMAWTMRTVSTANIVDYWSVCGTHVGCA